MPKRHRAATMLLIKSKDAHSEDEMDEDGKYNILTIEDRAPAVTSFFRVLDGQAARKNKPGGAR